MGFLDYISLLRIKFHLSYAAIVAVALLTKGFSAEILRTLAALYVIFNVLLYGGIYTINAIADIKSDSKHPFKKYRPLPSGKISIRSAWIFSVLLVFLGLSSAFFYFGSTVFYMFIAFLAINLFYTFVAKKIIYLDLISNTSTHALRFILAFIVVEIPIPLIITLSFSLLAFGFTTVNRISELDIKAWKSRNTLKYYGGKKLLAMQISAFAAIMILFMLDNTAYKNWHLIVISSYAVCIFGIYISKSIRTSLGGIFISK